MAVFMVSYDLRKQRNYQALYDRLAQWNALAILESVWVIKWDTTATAIRDDLLKHIDNDDGLVVARLSGEAAWHELEEGTSPMFKKWLENR